MKNIYDMLNDVDIDLDEYEKEDFNDIEKQRIKKKFKKSINRKNNNNKKYVAVASAAVITIGLLSNSNIRTYAYEKLVDIGNNIKSALGIEVNLDEYVENINQSVTRNGLTVSIKEVVLDGNELLIFIEHEYDKDLKEGESIELISEKLYVNGKKVNKGMSGYYTKRSGSKSEFVLGYELDKAEYKGDIDVKLRIMDAYKWEDEKSEDFKRIIGPWTFKFKVNADKVSKDTKIVKLDKDIKLENGFNMDIVEYKQNKLNQVITIKSNNINEIENDGVLVFKGTDNFGNDIEFSPKNGMADSRIGYKYEFDSSKNEFNFNTQYLSVAPYIRRTIEKDGKYHVKDKKIGEEFKIDLR